MKLPESFYNIIFSFLELSLILGSLGVVLLGNTVYSAFLLGFVFVGISLLYLLLGADFVAAAQILIYVGAVNVLIVFAVTLINKKQSQNVFLYWTIGDGIALVTCTGIFISLNNAISNTSWSEIRLFAQSNSNRESIILAADNTRRIGLELLTDFLIPFELMSIILLVALIGAIALARKDRIADTENKVLRNESERNL
uniref:NAD(P)H-quinone oxidoreductase subunit 6, chloroplastic n=1 Tax=Pallavicinia longispina TaxID=280536 RepID=A0AAT9UTE2_9MARC